QRRRRRPQRAPRRAGRRQLCGLRPGDELSREPERAAIRRRRRLRRGASQPARIVPGRRGRARADAAPRPGPRARQRGRPGYGQHARSEDGARFRPMNLRWLPNAICVVRVLLVVPLVVALLEERYEIALILLVIAGGSDGLDGFLAKRFDWRT